LGVCGRVCVCPGWVLDMARPWIVTRGLVQCTWKHHLVDLITLRKCTAMTHLATRSPAEPQHTGRCTEHSAHSTVHTAQCTLHSAHCTVHTALCTLHCAHCTVHRAQCTEHCAHCTVHTALCTLHCAQSTCTMHSEQCTQQSASVCHFVELRFDRLSQKISMENRIVINNSIGSYTPQASTQCHHDSVSQEAVVKATLYHLHLLGIFRIVSILLLATNNAPTLKNLLNQ
jgi:hypothetical protein